MKIHKMPQAVNDMDDPYNDMYSLMFQTTGWYQNLHGIYIHPVLGSVYWDNGSVHGYSTDLGWSAEIESITYYV